MSDIHYAEPPAGGSQADVLEEPRLKEPPRYAVLLHNDDYTSMEFVVQILCEVFFKTMDDATSIMLKVHREGVAKCGAYTKEVAETKVRQVTLRARLAEFPLKCTMDPE